MNRILLVLSLLLIVAALFLASPLVMPSFSEPGVRPLDVPTGDQEIVWLHDATRAQTWERFVFAVRRASAELPGILVDDSRAFPEGTDVPELVLGRAAGPRVRIRWYKIHAGAVPGRWISLLAARHPAPIAVIGGFSSGRATETAQALERQKQWQGDRPAFFVMQATSEKVEGDNKRNFIDLYDERTFRFCFSNHRMAETVLDFVESTPGLRPHLFSDLGPLALCSGLSAETVRKTSPEIPKTYKVCWQDDPYSVDLSECFENAIFNRWGEYAPVASWTLPYGIGGFSRANRPELEAADMLFEDTTTSRPQRSILILPTGTQPTRRFLRSLSDKSRVVGRRLVAVTGDGINMNTFVRDGEFAWPVQSIPIPMVLFAHADPFAWGSDLPAPTATDDVNHFVTMTQILCEAVFPSSGSPVVRGDELVARLKDRKPPFFDAQGERRDDTGEHVVLLWPQFTRSGSGVSRLEATIPLEIWKRVRGKWELVRTVESPWRKAGGKTP